MKDRSFRERETPQTDYLKEPIQAENPDERVVDRRAFLSGAASLIALSATQAVAAGRNSAPVDDNH